MTIADSRLMVKDGVIYLPCTTEEERRTVEEFRRKSKAVYYAFSFRWFVGWKKYAGLWDVEELIGISPIHSHDGCLVEESSGPRPIDNMDIIMGTHATEVDEPQLAKGSNEGQDSVLVPEDVWEKLFDWHRGGPAPPRKMLTGGLRKGIFSVEVDPLLLNLIASRDGKVSILQFSKQDSVCKLYGKMCSMTGVDYDKIIIRVYFNRSKQSALLVSEQSLEDVPLTLGQDNLLKVKKDMAPAPYLLIGGNSFIYEGGFLSTGSAETNTAPEAKRSGLAGLENLGNTCFMNCAIQCLAHTSPLVEYFLTDYSDDINTENPFGKRGELARSFGELLRELWSTGHAAVAPRDFKNKLGQLDPQFSGYAQHDSQELLAFLLDGLHEDLNRIKKKPNIESKDSDGRPDDEVSEECWKNHRARNDSLIVDVFQGQYKSTLTCSVCGKISVTFDPFMYVSMPIPSDTTRSMTITVFSGDGRGLPITCTVTVQQRGSVDNLLEALSSMCCLNTDEILLLAEVYGHKICKYFESHTTLSTIKDEDCLVAYRFQKKQVTRTKLEIYSGECSEVDGKRRFGCPLVTYLDVKHLTGDGIWSTVSKVLSPFSKKRTRLPEFQSEQENGTCLATDATQKCHIQLNDDVENAQMSTCILSMNLEFDRENAPEYPLTMDTVLLPGQVVQVFLDWTDTVHEFFDHSYIATIPVVKGDMALKKTKRESLTLFSCLESFVKDEPLGLDDLWYCPACKEHRQAAKKLDIWRLPEILIFHFKRFSYSRVWKNKLDHFVDFPVHDLDLNKYVKSGEYSPQPYVYELYGIINHYGGLQGGHYTAYVKMIDEDEWFHFDDSTVSPISKSNIKTGAAYVLFYQRVRSKIPQM